MGLSGPIMGAAGGLAGGPMGGLGGLAGLLAGRGRKRGQAVNRQLPPQAPQGQPQDTGLMQLPFQGGMEPFQGTPPVLQDMPLQDLAGLQQFVPQQQPPLRMPGAIYEDYGGQQQQGNGLGGLLASLRRRY